MKNMQFMYKIYNTTNVNCRKNKLYRIQRTMQAEENIIHMNSIKMCKSEIYNTFDKI